MNNMITIAISTLREAIRNKVLYSFIGFALVFMIVSIFLGDVTIGQKIVIIKTIGLSAIELFGIFIAIFTGVSLIYKEIDKRTIYTILARPISRTEFLLGKYFGLVLTLFILIVIMSLFFLGLTFYYEHQIDTFLLLSIGSIFLELMVITAMSILFSSYSSPFLSSLLTILFLMAGHMLYQIRDLGNRYNDFYQKMLNGVYYIIPNFENFNLKEHAVHHLPISEKEVFFILGYALVWVVACLMFASIIFKRRDFK